MSFIHYLFLGHFDQDGETVRLSRSPSDPVYKPLVRHPIDTEVIEAILREVKGPEVTDLGFPEDWLLWMEDGYLVCDKYTRNREAITFIARLVERTRCDMYDVCAHCDIALHEWLAIAHGYSST